jgi:beta-lactamase regulating signal transducer with metallopeptidase domain
MTTWSEALGYWLADVYAVSTIVLLAAGVALSVSRQPARRLALAWSALVGLSALTIVAALPGWPRANWAAQRPTHSETIASPRQGSAAQASLITNIRSGAPQPARSRDIAPATRPEAGQTAEGSARPAPLAAAGESDPASTRNGLVVAAVAFLTGGVLMLAWLGLGFWQTSVLRHQSAAAPVRAHEALTRVASAGRDRPDLLQCARLSQPVAVGLLRPTIILPKRFVENEPQCRLEAALAHEYAHIRNRDLWLIALSRMLMPILFAHPAYWWLRRRIRDDQELLADADASTAEGRIDYAAALLRWAAEVPIRSQLTVAGSLALWERPSQLTKRIAVLLDGDFCVETICPRRWRLGVPGAMVLAVLALSGLTFRPTAAGADTPPKTNPNPVSVTSNLPEAGVTIRVLDPDAKPAEGASVYRSDFKRDTAVFLTRTGVDGSFQLAREDARAIRDDKALVVVVAEHCGPAILDASAIDNAKELRLVNDDLPIRGRLLDIEGRAIPAATVQVVNILYPPGTLDAWRAALDAEKVAYPVQYRLLRSWSSHVASFFPAITTDREGRFTVKGVGRERIASLRISGPGVETRFEFVATRAMPAVKVAEFDRQNRSEEVTYHGASFDLVMGPALEIVGTVRDKNTGRPLTGAIVQTATAFGNPLQFLRTTTDAEGRYRLSGVPPKNKFDEDSEVLASVPGDIPYVPSIQSVEVEHRGEPITRDFALKRGVWARGRVTDKMTGKPVPAGLDYFIPYDNAHRKEYPKYGTLNIVPHFAADDDGRYKIVVMPGRGVLGASFGNGMYRRGVGIDKIKGLESESPGIYSAEPTDFIATNYNTLVEINPEPGDESVITNIELDRGRTLKGRLVGPDGAPVSGALMMGAEELFQKWSREPLPSADFEVHALGAEAQRGLLFLQAAKKLAAAYVVKPGEEGPVTVTMMPCGTLTGRLIDGRGLLRAGVEMTCNRPGRFGGDDPRFEHGSLPSPIKTDTQGRFEVSGLVPGLKYSLRVWKGGEIEGDAVTDVTTRAGETKDLGDVKVGR